VALLDEGTAEMLLFWASAVLVFVWRQNYNQPISGMAAFSAVHARAFLPSNPHPALLISPRTGSRLAIRPAGLHFHNVVRRGFALARWRDPAESRALPQLS
jgi:hypothetical protein